MRSDLCTVGGIDRFCAGFKKASSLAIFLNAEKISKNTSEKVFFLLSLFCENRVLCKKISKMVLLRGELFFSGNRSNSSKK